MQFLPTLAAPSHVLTQVLLLALLALVALACVRLGRGLAAYLTAARRQREREAEMTQAHKDLQYCDHELDRLLKATATRSLSKAESAHFRQLVVAKATLADKLDLPLAA